jgi:IS1 family transposase
MRSETEAKVPVVVCGRLFHQQAHAGHCFTDFWSAYQAVIPENQHKAAGKETGETAHVERWNNTLRQRLARFVRKTLSFSKTVFWKEQRRAHVID